MSEYITVFDIEILNNDPTSICSIGIVVLKDKRIVDTYYSLVRPHNLAFDKYRYGVHHIRPKSLQKERPFKDVWEEIHHYFEDMIVVSHDVQNDMAHIRACLKQAHIPYPTLRMSCTNVIAHILSPKLEKYNIADLSEFYNVPLNDAHNALSDAKACAFILVKMLNNNHYESLLAFHEKMHLELGIMKPGYYKNIISPDHALLALHSLVHPLSNMSIVFTGKLHNERAELEEMTHKAHAFVAREVNSHTNYLVVGMKDYKNARYGNKNNKVKKALSLMKAGQDLKIISENEYIRLIKAV